MLFDLSKLAPRDGYKLLSSTIVPRPIAWVVSMDGQGGLNAAPFSFFNLFSDSPPIICLGVMGRQGEDKDTSANIRERGEFVVNLVPEGLAVQMNSTAAEYERGVDELREAGLTVTPSSQISVPRIAECPVALECRVRQYVDLPGSRVIVVAEVLALHVDDEAVLDANRCYIDTPKLQLIARMHGSGEYLRTSDLFNMPRPTTPCR